MVVVVIIGVLGAIVVPQFMSRPTRPGSHCCAPTFRPSALPLEMYRLDTFNYPLPSKGIEALVSRPSGTPVAKNWNPQGYLKNVPVDWQGRAYPSPQSGDALGEDMTCFRWGQMVCLAVKSMPLTLATGATGQALFHRWASP